MASRRDPKTGLFVPDEARATAPAPRRRFFSVGRVVGSAAVLATSVAAVVGGKKLVKFIKETTGDIPGRTFRGGERAVQATRALDFGLGIARRSQRGSFIGRSLVDATGTLSRPFVAVRGFLKGFF